MSVGYGPPHYLHVPPDLPGVFSPDPAGIDARRETVEARVDALQTPIQNSPSWALHAGAPYPGPAAVTTVVVDYDSARWWGRWGKLVWSDRVVLSNEIPPALPTDLVQHVDVWQRFWGGYPSITRKRPNAWADNLAVFDPGT